MAFDYTNLYPDTANNGSLTKAWNYSTLDSTSAVAAVGYFNKVYNRLGIGDIIFVAAIDSFDARFRTSVSSVILLVVGISGQVVTTEVVAGSGGTTGALLIVNNLSDVNNVITSRTNLGVNVGSIDIVIDGAGAALTTGLKGYLPVAPFPMTITQWTLTANASGSVAVSIWKCTYAQFDAGATHPVAGDKITASAPPTLSSATKAQDSTLTGWTTSIAAGDILAFNIDSISTVQQIALSLKYTKA